METILFRFKFGHENNLLYSTLLSSTLFAVVLVFNSCTKKAADIIPQPAKAPAHTYIRFASVADFQQAVRESKKLKYSDYVVWKAKWMAEHTNNPSSRSATATNFTSMLDAWTTIRQQELIVAQADTVDSGAPIAHSGAYYDYPQTTYIKTVQDSAGLNYAYLEPNLTNYDYLGVLNPEGIVSIKNTLIQVRPEFVYYVNEGDIDGDFVTEPIDNPVARVTHSTVIDPNNDDGSGDGPLGGGPPGSGGGGTPSPPSSLAPTQSRTVSLLTKGPGGRKNHTCALGYIQFFFHDDVVPAYSPSVDNRYYYNPLRY